MHSNSAAQPATQREEPASLSWQSFYGALVALLAIFVLLNPIWKQNDMNAWNENIFWSYLAIPVVILGLLKLEHKLSWTSFTFETMKMTFIKFVLTYIIANAFWEAQGFPGTGIAARQSTTDETHDDYDLHAAPLASSIAPQSLGRLEGILTGPAGEAQADILIYVADGLSNWTFEPPSEPLVLRNDDSGFLPRQSVIQANQVLSLVSTSEALHTGVFSSLDPQHALKQRLINYPVIPGGQRQLMFERELGWLELSCSVHGDAEAKSQVLVLAHPFWTRTDQNGRFRFDALPAGEVRLRAWFGPERSLDRELSIAPGVTTQVRLSSTQPAPGPGGS